MEIRDPRSPRCPCRHVPPRALSFLPFSSAPPPSPRPPRPPHPRGKSGGAGTAERTCSLVPSSGRRGRQIRFTEAAGLRSLPAPYSPTGCSPPLLLQASSRKRAPPPPLPARKASEPRGTTRTRDPRRRACSAGRRARARRPGSPNGDGRVPSEVETLGTARLGGG